jgi:catalase
MMAQKPGTAAARGIFSLTHDLSPWTHASLFSGSGKQTECLARFSPPDAERAPTRFDLSLFTDEGRWDITGTNIPAQFSREPSRTPPVIAKDFWPLSPESPHYITLLFSDRGAPANYRQMHGYPRQTFLLTNSQNNRTWAKFCFHSLQPAASAAHESTAAWRLSVQLMTQAEADKLEFNPFDPTKIWPHSRFPPHEAGIMELNPIPAEAVPNAFHPARLIPSIGYPPENPTHPPAPRSDDYAQPGNLFRLMSQAGRERLVDNLAAAMKGVPEPVLLHEIAHFFLCDPAYGKGVAGALGLSLDHALAPDNFNLN